MLWTAASIGTQGAERIVDFIRAGNYEPFTSPTYVARLDPAAGFDIEVLRASIEPASAGDPGTIIDVSAAGPLIVCGDGAIRIAKARRGRQAMTLAQWHDYVAHVRDRRLLGRSEAER